MNNAEPMPKAGRPEALECLTPAARVHFTRYVDHLAAVNVVTVLDGVALSALSQSTAVYEEATRQLEQGGKVVQGQRGPQRSPWVLIQKQALDQMQRLFSEYGLTASSRSNVSVRMPHARQNPFANLTNDTDDEERFFGDNA